MQIKILYLTATEADLNKFDKIIDEVEPGALRLPVLLKKYIKQNCKLIGFNVDPLFNNAVDGLMYIKIADLPESTVRPVLEEFQAELERKFSGQSETKIFIILLILFCLFVNAQTFEGKVLEVDTNQPLEAVSVYFDGTSIGTITNSEGFFSIELPENKNTKSLLVISSVGYQTLTVSNNALKLNTTYYLTEKETSLDEVVLFDDWSRRKKLNIFRRQFLGSDKESLKCEIKNEDAIRLVYNKSDNQLYASANQPIVIVNKALGYKVYYDLVDFEVTFTNCLDCFRGVKTVFYSGTSRFEELNINKVKSKYIKARKKSYYGSLLHFMRSLSTNSTKMDGFELFIKAPAKESELYFNTNIETVFETIKRLGLVQVNLLQKHKVVIRYNTIEQSALLIEDEDKTFFIDDFGIHSPVDKIIFGGRFGHSRLSTMLPNNYYPN